MILTIVLCLGGASYIWLLWYWRDSHEDDTSDILANPHASWMITGAWECRDECYLEDELQ